MEQKSLLDGRTFKEMLAAGADWLAKVHGNIDALNVYPVPDGDTGTNMLLTVRASLESIQSASNGSASSVVTAIDRGALMGARGNSGVILSQIFHGLAKELQGHDTIETHNLARALERASETAYGALSNPEEGTMLTVIRDVANAAKIAASCEDASTTSVLTAAVSAARESVINTPNLLPVLAEAGVVDAGGHGLFTILEGALLYLKGETNGSSPELLCRQQPLITHTAEFSHEDDYYGFCTQFMVNGKDLSAEVIRKALQDLGESLIVVGGSSTIRVHIHSRDTEAVTATAASFGEVVDVDIRSMDEQHQDFLLIKNKGVNHQTSVVAVVNGPGLVNAFADLGVAAIVPGGQTMNPSAMDILNTVEKVDSDAVIILPNNSNVVSTALLVKTLTNKHITVIPTKTIPQGIAAMIDFVPEADFETNATQMASNIDAVKTLEITRATRTARVNGLKIESGQFIGLIDNKLLVACNTPEEVVFELLNRLDMDSSCVVTLYFGKNTAKDVVENLCNTITSRYPNLSVGSVNGGQPDYQYIISVE